MKTIKRFKNTSPLIWDALVTYSIVFAVIFTVIGFMGICLLLTSFLKGGL